MSRLLTIILACLLPQIAHAQEYPAHEIRSLCNYAPGSGADIIVRFYSDRLSKLAGRPVIVENKVGANGSLATDALPKSRPDGYTILITPASSTIASAPYLFKSLPFDTEKDFAAVTTIASLSFVIMVDAAKPLKSVDELMELLKARAGLRTTYVPYKQNVQALTDLLLGQLDFLAFDATWAAGQAKGGKIRILAATATKRSVALPYVPTLTELGYGGNDVSPWWGVVVAAGTPRPIVEKLSAWFNEITAAEDTRQFLANSAFDPFPGSPGQMQELLKTDAARWKRYV